MAEIIAALIKGGAEILALVAGGKITDEQALEHLHELTSAIPVRSGDMGTAHQAFELARARIRARAGKA